MDRRIAAPPELFRSRAIARRRRRERILAEREVLAGRKFGTYIQIFRAVGLS